MAAKGDRSKRVDIRSQKTSFDAALKRAARTARRIAYETGTPLIVFENGRVVRKRIVRKPR